MCICAVCGGSVNHCILVIIMNTERWVGLVHAAAWVPEDIVIHCCVHLDLCWCGGPVNHCMNTERWVGLVTCCCACMYKTYSPRPVLERLRAVEVFH